MQGAPSATRTVDRGHGEFAVQANGRCLFLLCLDAANLFVLDAPLVILYVSLL